MAKRKKAARGQGSIRKKEIPYNGKTAEYYEGRYTEGFDPGTGKQIQRSITAKTEEEVRKKLTAAISALDTDSYISPSKMTLSEWLDIWAADYLLDLKPGTRYAYEAVIRNHIKPRFGAVDLKKLEATEIQKFYNSLRETHAAKTVLNVHSILRAALSQAVLIRLIASNPTDACKPPRAKHAEMHVLDESLIGEFLDQIQGESFEYLFYVTLFTGMRKGEVLGLTWDCVDFRRGTILINKQLQRPRDGDGTCVLVSTKTDKPRKLTPAKSVMEALQCAKDQQDAWQNLHGPVFQNPLNLVFTNELGGYLNPNTVYNHFKSVVTKMGVPELRFHDLRHTYAVASLIAGDDIKTLQDNLGHSTAAFTLNVYGHVTDEMKQESANRMERFIHKQTKKQ